MTNVQRLLLALLLPSTCLTAVTILGTVLLAIGRRSRWLRRTGVAILAIGVAGFASVLLLPVDTWLLRPLEDRFPPVALSHIDGVVVLGGAVSETVSAERGTPSLNRDADRLVAFAALARAWPDARLVFAGGPAVPAAGGSLTEAEASRAILEQLGLAPGRVLYRRPVRNHLGQRAERAGPGEAEAGGNLGSGHLGQPYAARDGGVPGGGMAGVAALAGRLPHHQKRLAAAAATRGHEARRHRPRRARVVWAGRLPAERPHRHPVSWAVTARAEEIPAFPLPATGRSE